MASLIVSADLALNHGAVVDEYGKVLYWYGEGKGRLSSFVDLLRIAEAAVDCVPLYSSVAIDYDVRSSSWGKDPVIGTKMIVLGTQFAVLAMERKACEVHLVSPATVRKCLGISVKANKQACWEAVRSYYPPTLTKETKGEAKGDALDAWIMCYAFRCISGE